MAYYSRDLGSRSFISTQKVECGKDQAFPFYDNLLLKTAKELLGKYFHPFPGYTLRTSESLRIGFKRDTKTDYWGLKSLSEVIKCHGQTDREATAWWGL